MRIVHPWLFVLLVAAPFGCSGAFGIAGGEEPREDAAAPPARDAGRPSTVRSASTCRRQRIGPRGPCARCAWHPSERARGGKVLMRPGERPWRFVHRLPDGSAPEPPSGYGAAMATEHVAPWGTPRPCWHCTSFDRIEPAGCGLCLRPGASRRRAAPADGCAFWQREVGADDEPEWVPEFVSTAPRGARVWKPREAPPAPAAVRTPVRWAP